MGLCGSCAAGFMLLEPFLNEHFENGVRNSMIRDVELWSCRICAL